jgi:hypothetical protein
MKCLVCKKDLEEYGPHHPIGAINFGSPGHYGTTVFDPMDGSFLTINVCDGCLTEALKEGLATIVTDEVEDT